MQAASWRRALPVLLCLTLPGGAVAADVTPDQAALLQQQVQAALRSMAGSPDPSVRMRAAGDHYDVTVSLAGQDATATARQNPGGAWAIDAIRLPATASFNFDGPGTGTTHVATAIASQDAHAVYDPGRTTPSFLAGRYDGVSVAVLAPHTRTVTHLENCRVSVRSVPAASGTTDVSEAFAVTGYSSETHAETGGPRRTRAAQARLSLNIASLSAAASQAWTHLAELWHSAMLSGLSPVWDARTRVAAHEMVLALRGLLTGFDITESAEGVHTEGGGTQLDIGHISAGLAASAPADALTAQMPFEIAGLSVPGVPVAQGGDLIPRRLSLRPVLSGLSMRDLTDIALSATAPDADWRDIAVQLVALLSRGGIGLALENVALDVGPARFAGAMHAQVAGLARNSGEGRIAATGFDALVARLRELPKAAGLLPVLARLREIARGEGDTLVWDLSLKDSHLLVNGVDLAALPQAKRL